MNTPETFNRVVTVGVDIENDFSPTGSLPVPYGDEVVPTFNNVAAWTREQPGGVVAFTKDWHPEHTNHFETEGGPWPVHCVADTYGSEFIDGLDVQDGDPILLKGTEVDEDAYSGFQAAAHDGLTLETLVHPLHGERVAILIGGLATDYCVKETVLDALRFADHVKQQDQSRQLGVFVLRDAIRAVNIDPLDGDKAIEEMRAAGAQFVSSEEVVRNLAVEVRN